VTTPLETLESQMRERMKRCADKGKLNPRAAGRIAAQSSISHFRSKVLSEDERAIGSEIGERVFKEVVATLR
jgi:hypothetical protein